MNSITPLKQIMAPLLIGLASLACGPWVTTFEELEEAEYYQAATLTAAPAAVDTLLVMTWNIKYAGGKIDFWWACFDDRVLMTEEETLGNLERLVEKINAAQPDILLLQEVDVDSKRSAYINQMQYLLDHTDMNYGVYASMWRVQFVPSDGLGRADLGLAILSRWPLEDAQRISLALRTDQDPLTTYFYLRRCIVRAGVAIPGRDPLQVVNVHTAAFPQDDTKLRHIDRFKEELDAIQASGDLFVAGGDLNSLPPGSHRLKDFPDEKCLTGDFEGGDYTREAAWLDNLYATYRPAVPLGDFQNATDQSPFFSFGAKPDSLGLSRKLDYLFTNGTWVSGSAVTHQDIIGPGFALSDHVPLTARLVLGGSGGN